MFHADIKSKAETDTGLSVHAGRISARTTLPAIAYVTNFDTREIAMSQPSAGTKKVVTFYIMARSYDDLETTAEALDTGFTGFGGTMGDTHVMKGARLIADETAPELYDFNGQPAFLRTMSFSITHR